MLVDGVPASPLCFIYSPSPLAYSRTLYTLPNLSSLGFSFSVLPPLLQQEKASRRVGRCYTFKVMLLRAKLN